MTAVAQTPGNWLNAAGVAVGWTKECRAALIACGVNPDNFGTYDERQKSQSKLRSDYADQRNKEAADHADDPSKGRPHEPGCKGCTCYKTPAGFDDFKNGAPGTPANPNKNVLSWMEANSESGHISNDAFYHDSGTEKRGDPCANVKPSYGGDPPNLNAGGFGYQGDQALCMDHFGKANEPGSLHHQVTGLERNQSAAIRADPDNPGNVANEATIAAGVDQTAALSVTGANAIQNGTVAPSWDVSKMGLDPKAADYNQRLSELQQRQAKELQAKEGSSGPAGNVSGAQAGNPNSPSGDGPSDQNKDKAIDCIKDAWKKSLVQMRNNCVRDHSTVNKAKQDAVDAYNGGTPPPSPPAKNYNDIPAGEREQTDKDIAAKAEARKKELEQMGAGTQGIKGKDGKPPTADDCLEFQANWLDAHRQPDGSFPPVQGTAQRTDGPTTVAGEDKQKDQEE